MPREVPFGNESAVTQGWWKRSREAIAVGCVVLCAGWLDWICGGLLAPFYAPVVAIAGLRLGWVGGLLTALAFSFVRFSTSVGIQWTPVVIDTAALASVGVAVGLLSARDQHQKRHYQRMAEQLGTVYERVQANFEGMKRAERLSALGQLSAGLAHEIRNPLASISGAAAILRRSKGIEPKQEKCIDIISNESNRLDGLLTSFLNFARPRPPRIQNVDLAPVLGNVLALAGHGIRGKSVELVNRVEPGLPPVPCDPEQLEQVLLNLMINAIEASPDGDIVELGASLRGESIVVEVVDHGHGVAAAHVERLFDPFFTTKEHGTGLGLPVAHQIMSQMGGSLLARKNAGEGMTFCVVLPPQRTHS